MDALEANKVLTKLKRDIADHFDVGIARVAIDPVVDDGVMFIEIAMSLAELAAMPYDSTDFERVCEKLDYHGLIMFRDNGIVFQMSTKT